MKGYIEIGQGDSNSDKLDEACRLLPHSGASNYTCLEVGDRSGEDDTLSNENSAARWRVGLTLAIISGLLFTANNFLIQFFKIDSLDILFVRSVVQTLVLGFTIGIMNATERDEEIVEALTPKVRIFVLLQAIIGAVRLYLNFSCLAYLPLGDALTIIFTEPLFTMILSCLAYRVRCGIFRLALALGLVLGMVLCIQPPILFSKNDSEPSFSNFSNFTMTPTLNLEFDFTTEYYSGVAMALGCAICGSLCNIFINKATSVRSSSLVFFAGVFGIIVSILGQLVNKDFTDFRSFSGLDWTLLVGISFVGISAYFTMTAALQIVSPTSVSVLRALEIVLAYLCQAFFIGQYPNAASIGGAVLVMTSVVGIAIDEKFSSDQL